MEQQEGYEAVERLKANNGTPEAVFEGVKAANGWHTGKMLTGEEYKKAVEAFEHAPMDGREVKQNVQRD